MEAAHRRVVEGVTDLAGRRAAPTQRSWRVPLADSHNLQLETQRRLVKEIPGHIQRLAQDHPGLGIWLAAPKEINHLILESNLSRDLVKADKEKLLECFTPVLLAAGPRCGGKGPSPLEPSATSSKIS